MKKKILPLIPLRDIVIFPSVVIPLFIGRKQSLKTLEIALSNLEKNFILFVAQKNSFVEKPLEQNLYKVGVKAKIIQVVKLPNGNIKILIEAIDKVRISNIETVEEVLQAEYEIIDDDYENNDLTDQNLRDVDLIVSKLISVFNEYAKLNKVVGQEVLLQLSEKKEIVYVTSIIASHITCKLSKKQNILEIPGILNRANALISILEEEVISLNTEKLIQDRVKKQMEKTQRDYYLNEKMKAIEKELRRNEESFEVETFEKKIKSLKLSKEAKEKANSEVKKYKLMNQMSSEAAIVRNYLDTLLSLPWGKIKKPKISLKQAMEKLDSKHYGLEKVKERIIEYLAVLQRIPKTLSTILCLVGPPGVGKTSLVKSIAEAMGRPYCKFSLGGVKDESEVRGHRRTYIGSMPGKIISLLKKVEVDNPVMLLDEVDKMCSDFRGDPASALLEALDPEQNNSFVDHYLEVGYDLSNVIFIVTANSLNMPTPLLDRMEIIKISGYTEDEKLQIAKKHLIDKQIKLNGLKKDEITITNGVIHSIINHYTRESGVRALEREIAKIARKSLKKILETEDKLSSKTRIVDTVNLEELLGVKKFRINFAEKNDIVGVTTGLAYTEVGGDLLAIEAVIVPGKGTIRATGKLGEVMKESTQTAFSFFCAIAKNLGIDNIELKDKDIHLHVPEGAIPKDGPSAGIAIFTTIVSLMTKVPVKKTVAMTGEITLRGRVLAIGGLREKLLAADRGQVKTVIIPKDNLHDLKEVPDIIKQGLEIIPIVDAQEALNIALVKS